MQSKNISYQSSNKDKIKENKIEEEISPNSTCEEVSKFLKSIWILKGM